MFPFSQEGDVHFSVAAALTFCVVGEERSQVTLGSAEAYVLMQLTVASH